MPKQKRVLMVLSSHELMGLSGKKAGSWFDEVATPYYLFKKRAFDVVLATPLGGPAPIDPMSAQPPYSTPNTERFEKDPIAQQAIATTARLSDVNYRDFDGVFFPGGYGPIWDLASNSLVIKIIEETFEAGKPMAFPCHGPASLRDAKKSNGEPLVKGLKVTGFSDAEDEEIGLRRYLLFSVEQMLKANGGIYSRAEKNWDAHIVEDGALLTGQTPSSSAPISEAFANRLR
jgi:putative intracellular protease/amidase